LIVHDKWTKTGRVLKDTENPNRHIWESGVGQANVDLGGDFAPYVWDKISKVLKFAKTEIRFTSTGLEFWNSKKLFTSTFYPETKSTDWDRPVSVVSGLTIKENKGLSNKDTIEITYKITTNYQESNVTIKVGGSSQAILSFKIKAKTAGFHRLNWDCGIIENGALNISEPYYNDRKQKMMNPTKYIFKDFYFGWANKEWKDHNINDTDAKFELQLKEEEYEQDEIKVLSPSTWGETEITTTNDDCECDDLGNVDLNGFDSDGDRCGKWEGTGRQFHNGYRWQNVPVGKDATINSAYIKIDIPYLDQQPVDMGLYGCAEDDADDWSAGTAPTARDKTDAFVNWDITASGDDQQSGDISDIIAEITSRGGWSATNSLAVLFWTTETTNYDNFQVEDYTTQDGGHEATRIYIDYTDVAGGETHQLAGVISIASMLSGDINVKRSLLGAVNGTTALSALLQRTSRVTGSCDGVSNISGRAYVKRACLGIIDAVSSLSGSLNIKRTFSGVIEAVSSFVGSLTLKVTASLGGIINAVSTLGGSTISIKKRMIGSMASAAVLSGNVTLTKGVTGLIEAVSSFAGSTEIKKAFVGTINIESGLVGNIQVERSIAGIIEAVSTLSGSLTFKGEAVWVHLDGIVFYAE